MFVYENYPIATAALSPVDELNINGFTNREYNHYPLSVQAMPGHESSYASNSILTSSLQPESTRWSNGSGAR